KKLKIFFISRTESGALTCGCVGRGEKQTRPCHGVADGLILPLRANVHPMSECSGYGREEGVRPRGRRPRGGRHLRRYRMANGRIVPPAVPMTITQIAVVVRDMESALRSYTENLGWGPWSVFDYKPPLLHDTVVRGEPREFRMIGAETSVNGLGFELIQPVSGPSIYQEFLDTHGEGVQHIACMKHSTEDSEALKKHWQERGAEILMGGRIGASIEFYYLDTSPMLKFVLESGSGHAIDLEPTYVFP